jgi:hypothetical protein
VGLLGAICDVAMNTTALVPQLSDIDDVHN